MMVASLVAQREGRMDAVLVGWKAVWWGFLKVGWKELRSVGYLALQWAGEKVGCSVLPVDMLMVCYSAYLMAGWSAGQ